MAVDAERGPESLTPPPVVAVVGPTATGKTAFAVRLAERLGRAELLNADSRQMLRGLRVGTNTPGPEELAGVPCHLLGITEPGCPFSVADWLAAARDCLAALDVRGVRPIVVGGTGLYVRALLDGLDLDGSPPDPVRRAALNARASSPEGLAELAADLRQRDPEGAAGIDLRNPRRVVRGLEIVEARGSLAGRGRGGTTRPSVRIGVDAAPDVHREWIAERAGRMMAGGLLEETAAALARGVTSEALDGSGIGYREALAVLDGRLSAAEAITEIARRTVRYAKAQRTWFRADRGVVWLQRESGDDLDGLVSRALELARGRGTTGAA
ncbi:MAG: tRNA (adenosine(37)-N6)-dimethylallyltransferase MiaA [Candidatus Dormibacteria bacterium]|jgi:tRNA dimethylallyltransferase